MVDRRVEVHVENDVRGLQLQTLVLVLVLYYPRLMADASARGRKPEK